MRPTTIFIHGSRSCCLSLLSFEEVVQCFFFVVDDDLRKTFDVDFALGVVEDGDGGAAGWVSFLIGEEIEHLFVVDLKVADLDGEIFVGVGADLLENLGDRSWDDTSIFEVWGRSVHGKGLSCAGLPIAHDSSVESVCY